MKVVATVERFWSKVMVLESPLFCWPWVASLRAGYGLFSTGVGTRTMNAHRFAYEQSNGPIPVGLEVDHLCRNRACCNPAHLEAVTPSENVRRAAPFADNHERKVAACPQGHGYTPENTWRHKVTGHRFCRQCNRDKQAARRSRGI